jgi:hypothetical protein
MIFEGTSTRSDANPAHVDDSPKKPITGDKIKPLGSQRVGHESKQLGVTWIVYFITSSRTGKYQSQHVLLHPKEYGDHPTKNK